MSNSNRNATSPTTGGGLFSGIIKGVARSVFESAMNSTNVAASGSGVVPSRSFFDLGSGNDSTDGGSGGTQVIEYSGKSANTEIARIYPVSLRAGDLILHGPCKEAISLYTPYNIILHATNSASTSEKMYSLFRTESESDASRMFVIYKQIFPDLVKASSTPLDRTMLEKIVKMSKKHEAYGAAHIAAALNMIEQLKSPTIQEKFLDQEQKLLHTPLHVACVHGKLEAFRLIAEDERTFNRVYDYDDLKGNTIVHLAAASKDKAVGATVLKVVKERVLQRSGPQHKSASRILYELFQKLNNEGYAPIHLACQNANKEVVEEIVEVTHNPELVGVSNVNLLDTKMPATGNTALHLTTSNPALLAQLLDLGSDANIVDNDGVTPLHKAVLESNLKSTLLLLSNNAYPNFAASIGDEHRNATPLHVAASMCAVDCLKALIVFGADIEMKNEYGQTARHIVASISTATYTLKQEALFVLSAAGAKRCGVGVAGGCTDGCKSGGKNDGKKPDNWKIKRDGTAPPGAAFDGALLVHEAMRGLSIVKESFENGHSTAADQVDNSATGPVVGGRLLCLDGGGIRGLVLTQMLFFLEKEFGNISGGGVPIISYFDWIAGTSTGGILALALASGKSVLETQCLYMKLKDKVFTGSRPYSASKMEEFLKREFGPDTKMSSIQKPRVMIMTSLANRRPPDLYIFRNYISPSCILGDPEEHAQYPDDTYIWETAKVTGAAPSYFTLDHELFIDGGLISNNPTLDALSELTQFKAVMMNSQQHSGAACNYGTNNAWKLPSLVLSLGTGIPPRIECDTSNLDIGWPSGLYDAIKNVPRLSQLVNLLVDQATQAEGQVVERARAWCTSIGVPFFRFSPEMSADIDLDEKKDDVLVNLMWETWCYMVGNRSVFREIFERLRELDVTRPNCGPDQFQHMETQ